MYFNNQTKSSVFLWILLCRIFCYNVCMNKTYIPTLIVLVALASLHFYASANHLYHTIGWYDIMMHILGGVGIALSIYWILLTFFKDTNPSLLRVILYTFIAGFFWEAFETMNDIAGAPLGTTAYFIDSAKDLINDTLGAILAMVFLPKK
jgi:hypothetical protein